MNTQGAELTDEGQRVMQAIAGNGHPTPPETVSERAEVAPSRTHDARTHDESQQGGQWEAVGPDGYPVTTRGGHVMGEM